MCKIKSAHIVQIPPLALQQPEVFFPRNGFTDVVHSAVSMVGRFQTWLSLMDGLRSLRMTVGWFSPVVIIRQ